MSEFGRKLRMFLAEFNIKKKDFADGVDVSAETVTNWLHHGIKPQKENVQAINAFTEGYITEADCD